MAYKVTKKGKLFAVVKDDSYYGGDWYVIDVSTSKILKHCWSASNAKSYLDMLENGYDTPETYDTPWNSYYGKPIDMPASLKKMQQQILNPKPKKQSQKPIGSTSTSISETIDNGTHYILKMDDGTFGVLVKSTGESKMGLKSLGGAKTSAKSMLKKSALTSLGNMGVDPGSDAVDTLIKTYEDRVRDVYGQAAREMTEKQAKYMEEFAKLQKEMAQKLADGKITMSQYQSWLRTQDMTQSWFKEMVESLSEDLVAADQNAMRILNGYVPRAYAENMNFATYQIEDASNVNTSFALYNESTVARLIANPEGSLLPELPQPETDAKKDGAWSKQKISSAVTQSILQGESVPEAAKRLQMVVGMSANSAMRAARTALTGAQNLGRLDAGRRAKKMGIQLKKQWIATVDARTRYAHREIDRETVELEEDFSNGCDCPGHLNSGSDAGQVYNCRCAMRYVIPGHEYDDLPEKTREGVDYEEWKNERLTKLAAQKDKIQAQLDDANAHINDLKKLLPADEDFSSKFHTNIISGTSQVSKWSEQAVAQSEDYYFTKLQEAITKGNQYDIDWYKKRLLQLKEYDDAGRAYHDASKAIEPQIQRWQNVADNAKKKLAELAKSAGGSANAYSQDALDNAYKFVDDPYGGTDGKKECDNLLRSHVGEAWRNATQAQRKAAYTYTTNDYEYYNRPLNGFDRSYGRFVGYGQVDIDNEGYASEIRELTTFLEHCENPVDRWVRRGTSTGEMDTFFGFPTQNRFGSMTDEELQGLVGHSARIGSFLSTGNCVGDSSKPSDYSSGVYQGSTGFGGTVDIQIFVPKGAQAAYAVPFSAFDAGDKLSWDGLSEQYMFRSENETILQRGGSYTCIGIERHGSRYLVKLEVHPEDGYDLFQQ